MHNQNKMISRRFKDNMTTLPSGGTNSQTVEVVDPRPEVVVGFGRSETFNSSVQAMIPSFKCVFRPGEYLTQACQVYDLALKCLLMTVFKTSCEDVLIYTNNPEVMKYTYQMRYVRVSVLDENCARKVEFDTFRELSQGGTGSVFPVLSNERIGGPVCHGSVLDQYIVNARGMIRGIGAKFWNRGIVQPRGRMVMSKSFEDIDMRVPLCRVCSVIPAGPFTVIYDLSIGIALKADVIDSIYQSGSIGYLITNDKEGPFFKIKDKGKTTMEGEYKSGRLYRADGLTEEVSSVWWNELKGDIIVNNNHLYYALRRIPAISGGLCLFSVSVSESVINNPTDVPKDLTNEHADSIRVFLQRAKFLDSSRVGNVFRATLPGDASNKRIVNLPMSFLADCRRQSLFVDTFVNRCQIFQIVKSAISKHSNGNIEVENDMVDSAHAIALGLINDNTYTSIHTLAPATGVYFQNRLKRASNVLGMVSSFGWLQYLSGLFMGFIALLGLFIPYFNSVFTIIGSVFSIFTNFNRFLQFSTFRTWILVILGTIIMLVILMDVSGLVVLQVFAILLIALQGYLPLILVMLLPGITCGGALYMAPPIVSALLICLLFFVIRVVRNNRYRGWQHFRTSIQVSKKTVHFTGEYPPGASLAESEAEFTSYPPISKLAKIRPKKERRNPWVLSGVGWSEKPAVYAVGPIFSCRAPLVFSRSPNNMYASLRTRVVLETTNKCPEFTTWNYYTKQFSAQDPLREYYDGRSIDSASPFFDFVIKETIYFKWVEEDVYYNHMPTPKKRADLFEARKFEGSYDEYFLKYNVFVKREKEMQISYGEFTQVKPRCISAVSTYGKARFGCWFYNYYKFLKHIFNVHARIWLCSGYTMDYFNYWINDKLKNFRKPVFFCTDFSKFDVTQGLGCILFENYCYELLGFLEWALSMGRDGRDYLRAKADTKSEGCGWAVSLPGTRKSGDNDTTSGNSKITITMLSWFFDMHKLKFTAAVLGDDNFSILEYDDVIKVFQSFSVMCSKFTNFCAQFGLEVKTIATEKIVEAEFLSCRFYPVNGIYFLGKKPGRVAVKMGWFVNNLNLPEGTWMQILKCSLISCQAAGSFVPFLRIYIREVLSYLGGLAISEGVLLKFKQEMEDRGTKFESGALVEPAPDTFQAFYDFYGLDQNDEAEFELFLRQQLSRWGLHVILDSSHIEKLVSMDFELK